MDARALSDAGSVEIKTVTTARPDAFWYTNSGAIAFTLLLFILAQSVSLLTPPFQASDEPAHIKRAYLLSKGEIFLGSSDGATGGNIDTGLLKYINIFDAMRFQYGVKYTESIDVSARDIGWSGDHRFSRFPNTAFYFPLAYLPQAVALAIGERLGLTVQDTYYLARLFSLIATLALILGALLLYPAPPLVLAILVTPMVLFQFGSATLDSVSFGLVTLMGSLFMRGADERFSFSAPMFVGLVVSLFLLSTSRIALLALMPVPLALPCIRASRVYVAVSIALIVLSIAWIAYALATVEGVAARGVSTGEIIRYYLAQPDALLRVFFATLTDTNTLAAYWRMFVGVLGWLDTPLGSETYIGFGVLFVALTILGILRCWRAPAPVLAASRAWLACGAMLSILLVFFALLVTYNPHPTKTIGAVLGRYFIPMFIALAYACSSRGPRAVGLRLEVTLLALAIGLSVLGAVPRLLHRYWMG